MRTLHLFAGAGGGLLADLILGHQPLCGQEQGIGVFYTEKHPDSRKRRVVCEMKEENDDKG